jgi:ligand-binding SRPBCC domain-containing protein
MGRRGEFRIASSLRADPAVVWERMLSQRLWQHERTIEAGAEGGTTIVDGLAWEPRLPLPGRLLRPLIAAVFRHRHRQLQRHFGGASSAR